MFPMVNTYHMTNRTSLLSNSSSIFVQFSYTSHPRSLVFTCWYTFLFVKPSSSMADLWLSVHQLSNVYLWLSEHKNNGFLSFLIRWSHGLRLALLQDLELSPSTSRRGIFIEWQNDGSYFESVFSILIALHIFQWFAEVLKPAWFQYCWLWVHNLHWEFRRSWWISISCNLWEW